MINGRTFITILMIIFTVFFLFMFSGSAKMLWSDYNRNSFVQEDLVYKEPQTAAAGDMAYFGQYASVFGILRQWCGYRQWDIQQYGREGLSALAARPPRWAVVDGAYVQGEAVDILTQWAKAGVILVIHGGDWDFSSLSEEARALMGVRALAEEEKALEGIHLYPGFLLGGEALYQVLQPEDAKRQDMDLTADWFLLSANTKTYMSGILPKDTPVPLAAQRMADGSMAGRDAPPLLWQNMQYPQGVFVLNGGYLEDFGGLGMLSAMEWAGSDYQLYPIVNAQSLALANFPSFAQENLEEMERIYARGSKAVLRDVVWPGLVASASNSGHALTLMLRPGIREWAEPDGQFLIYFMKMLREVGAEAGVSLWTEAGIDGEAQRQKARAFLEEHMPEYHFQVAYVGQADFADMAGEGYGILLKPPASGEDLFQLGQGGGSYGFVPVTMPPVRAFLRICAKNPS